MVFFFFARMNKSGYACLLLSIRIKSEKKKILIIGKY